MQRIQERYLEKIETVVPLAGQEVLEIGCGDGARSVGIAERCGTLRGVDPDPDRVTLARARNLSNASFDVGSANQVLLDDHSIDVVIFTLSFHHVATENMTAAIDEAIRVVRKNGYIIFFEPTLESAMFDAEIYFDAWGGDERAVKRAAQRVIMHHPGLRMICEMADEAIVRFQSVEDFVEFTEPKQHQNEIRAFLDAHHYQLNAHHRITICQPKNKNA